jgi:hypothetical protein
MIDSKEFRTGNYLLEKKNGKIGLVPLGPDQLQLILQNKLTDLFPQLIKSDLLVKLGFTENMDYPLLPEAREFILVLPVIGPNKNEIRAYIKNNQEAFARYLVNGLVASNNVFAIHLLQNLYFSLTGKELSFQ